MGLFDLFRKSEWRKLKAYPPDIQQDIAYLVSFDSLIKTAVASAIRQTFNADQAALANTPGMLCTALTRTPLAGELHLSVLSTGVGKEFADIKWTYLPPARAVGFLGILAMCEFRNAEQLTVQCDLKHSGYSSDPDEARAQYLVVTAQTAGVDDLDEVKVFDDSVFLDFWSNLRKTVFLDIQLNVNSESLGLSAVIKDRFEKLSKPRQETLLLLADSLSKKKPNAQPPLRAASVKPAAPFNLAQSQKEHPFKYVPYPKLVKAMDKLSPSILEFFMSLSIDEYELRRVAGAKNSVPGAMLNVMAMFDADVLSYCIVVAAVLKYDPTFVGCGVWKKVTEIFQSKHITQFQVMAEAQANGMLGDAKINIEKHDPKKSSLGINLLQEIRRTPTRYTRATGERLDNLRLLLGGTIILRHVLNHPRYGSALGSFVMDMFASMEPVLDELRSGELLIWDQQENLMV